ncbi:MAG: Tol-Pal system protein TolQ [Candidatus Celerinatantimonas neptuna]|nr:MAG: Tol-Pal system protein TolQ [Candidatus Celerinatantimonas neptuna]
MKYWALLLMIVSCTGWANDMASFKSSAELITQRDQKLNHERQTRFLNNLKHQAQLLKQSESHLKAAQNRQQYLKKKFKQNEKELTQLSQQLRIRSGELGKVFTVLRSESAKFSQHIKQSLVSAERRKRETAFKWINEHRIPSANNLTQLQVLLQQQFIASGQISHFQHTVINTKGQPKHQQVTRLGEFELINGQGQFLQWHPNLNTLQVMPHQPRSANDYISGKTDSVIIDPTQGELLSLQARLPTIEQRIQQGGIIGYIIIALGLLGLIISIYRLCRLSITEHNVARQLSSDATNSSNNPLGRILNRIPDGQHPLEELELYVDEAVSQELPKLEKNHTLVKLFAGVTPLLGLLGTVTGMIETFQSITIFGSGDPKMMASGISQALMTTVLGLIAAIPLLFVHNLLTTKAQRISQILQQQSLALLASRLKNGSRHVSS